TGVRRGRATARRLPPSGPYAVVQESMRLNMELANTMIDRFPDMLRASAELLRAADAAGLPRGIGRVVEVSAADHDSPAAKRTDALASLLAPLLNICPTALTSAFPTTPPDTPAPEPRN